MILFTEFCSEVGLFSVGNFFAGFFFAHHINNNIATSNIRNGKNVVDNHLSQGDCVLFLHC